MLLFPLLSLSVRPSPPLSPPDNQRPREGGGGHGARSMLPKTLCQRRGGRPTKEEEGGKRAQPRPPPSLLSLANAGFQHSAHYSPPRSLRPSSCTSSSLLCPPAPSPPCPGLSRPVRLLAVQSVRLLPPREKRGGGGVPPSTEVGSNGSEREGLLRGGDCGRGGGAMEEHACMNV